MSQTSRQNEKILVILKIICSISAIASIAASLGIAFYFLKTFGIFDIQMTHSDHIELAIFLIRAIFVTAIINIVCGIVSREILKNNRTFILRLNLWLGITTFILAILLTPIIMVFAI